ncbi:MAG: sulfite exporter TauE/SafE family protein [Bacteroidetes bacterium]|nr:sulfite exporter TauE/SafE family protein [Bacteroidota bacterium]MDA0843127.1 sulfite exporter TauE/SafE family protein [Bacteroidota bacterium]
MIFESFHWMFLLLLPIVAFLYASVGHGGASGYLALMAIFSFEESMMKQTALTLNLFVAGIAFIHYFRAGYFSPRLFIWFALGSIPAAFIGGAISLDPNVYKRILGVLLIVSVLRMFFTLKETEQVPVQPRIAYALLLGAVIGLFSGLIGIGGGIILTPVLVLLQWARMKEAAAVSALFIWVNSAAGLAGQWQSGATFEPNSLILVVLALVGGIFGGYYGARRFSHKTLTYFLMFVLLLASVKLLLV